MGPSEEQEGGQWSVRGKELSGAYEDCKSAMEVGRSAGAVLLLFICMVFITQEQK